MPMAIYVDGNKLFEIENCLKCGKPHSTDAAHQCTEYLRTLDPSVQVCISAARHKRTNRDGDDNANPNRQPRVEPVSNLRDAPPDQVIEVVCHPRPTAVR